MNTENTACARIEEAIGQFDAKGVLTEKRPYGNGHINDIFHELNGLFKDVMIHPL